MPKPQCYNALIESDSERSLRENALSANLERMQLETARLVLRSFQDSDLDAFVDYRSDPDVARYQGWNAPFPEETAVAFIEEMKNKPLGLAGEWYQVAIALKASGTLIGDCAYHLFAEDARQAEIGFTLARAYQGHGYATEAVTALLGLLFGEFQLHRVTAICDIENRPSFHLLDRIGMRREGHFVKNIWFKGAWGSEYHYAMLYQEWQTHLARDTDSPPASPD